jgi:hypothetical protein
MYIVGVTRTCIHLVWLVKIPPAQMKSTMCKLILGMSLMKQRGTLHVLELNCSRVRFSIKVIHSR